MNEQTRGQKMIAALRQSGKSAALTAMYGVSTVRVLLRRHDNSSVLVTTRLFGEPSTAQDLLDRLRRAVTTWCQTEEGQTTLDANNGYFYIGDIVLFEYAESMRKCLLNEGVLSLTIDQDWGNGEDLDWNYNTNLFQENANTETHSADTQQGL